ncbi:MAG TPA: fibronectin type III domain-containing protein, partial [Thermoplasmata archaeon]|nr:fibronectin type III domain-containing protein [Thermoplasmata archaeon]
MVAGLMAASASLVGGGAMGLRPAAAPLPLGIALEGSSHPARAIPQASNDTISVTGTSPTATALSWKTSTDLVFGSYEVDESTSSSSGPWNVIYTNATASVTSLYVVGQIPGASAWFRDIDHGGVPGDNQNSNVVRAQNPPNATLSSADAGKSTVTLSWTNKAVYGGLLAFGSYVVKESINGASYTTLSTGTDPATTTYSVSGVTGLTTNTSYRFQVWTTDQCNSCANGSQPQVTRSTTATHLFIDQPKSAPSASVKIGSTISLSVFVGGGTLPYTFSWFELPSGCAAANTNPVSCT